MSNTSLHPVAAALTALRAELNDIFKERADLITASLLAILAREHVFALGAPGSAKSQLFRTIASAFVGADYFECALSKTRPAEAVLGPLDIKAFRENGDYRLKRKGFLTTVHLAMLDEIGKASPVLGHDLLAALNERIYHEVDDHGNSAHPIPLSTAFTASNEMLTDDSDDNAAIWDRLLFRVLVDYIQDSDNWKAMLEADSMTPETTLRWEDVATAAATEIPAIALSPATLEGLAGLKDAFAREQLVISDRRWRMSVKALQANAFLNGRSETSEADIEVLRFTLWETPQQIEKVERLCKAASNPYYEPVIRLREMLGEVADGMDERAESTVEVRADYAIEVTRKLRAANDQIITLELQAGDNLPPEVAEVRTRVQELMRRNLVEMMNQEGDAIEITMRTLLDGGQ